MRLTSQEKLDLIRAAYRKTVAQSKNENFKIGSDWFLAIQSDILVDSVTDAVIQKIYSEKSDNSAVAFDYVNLLETIAQHRSKRSFGEMSWAYVSVYMNADVAQTLMELNLSQRQLKILKEKAEKFEKELDSAGT